MKRNDNNLDSDLRKIRDGVVEKRWSQLYNLSKDSTESALKYLFTTNAGGAVAVLAYLGTTKNPLFSAKLSLFMFFIGLLFVGFYWAYRLNHHEKLFARYQNLATDYYNNKIDWNTITKSDKKNIDYTNMPYILGYGAFISFILGCIVAGFNFI